MKLLAIETSCDDASAAIVEANGTNEPVKVLAERVATQVDIHNQYGGVFPELAAREHFATVLPTVEAALKQYRPDAGPRETLQSLDGVAVTAGPGLIGSLLIGVTVAQTLCMACGKKLIPVNHMAGHMFSTWLDDSEMYVIPDQKQGALNRESIQIMDPRSRNSSESRMINQVPQFPALALTVSGGHTQLTWMESLGEFEVLGSTVDDAAGEAFDKVSVMLGLGYPGGPKIQSAAQAYDHGTEMPRFPRPMIDEGPNFSFSGLKTSVRYWLDKNPGAPVEAVAYEVQEAITDVLVAKVLKAAQERNPKSIILAGGVAANARLREKLTNSRANLSSSTGSPVGETGSRIQSSTWIPDQVRNDEAPTLHIPSRFHSTDNAAMVGAAAIAMLEKGFEPVDPATVAARSTWPLENW